MPDQDYKIAAFYKFATVDDVVAMQRALLDFCNARSMCGLILVAPEGLNATVAGQGDSVDQLLSFIRSQAGFEGLEAKFSYSAHQPFQRMKVKKKREIITMRQPEADPSKRVGTYVKPDAWNALIDDPDVVLIDTRNDYEVTIGTFKNAINPDIETFTGFVDYVRNNMDATKQKKVAMYCTGGIRCEKASAFMLAEGFENVYHLEGGILKYLEVINPEDSKWDGECFVFDKRISVGHGLKPGDHKMCYGCRHPLSEADMQSPGFEEGVCCPHCVDDLTPEKRSALKMRHDQFMREGRM